MEPFIAQIIMFGGNFAPRGWALCDGALLAISQNSALFSILGTTYGGDGRSTFGLPDLRGRFPLHPGSGAGLTSRSLGQKGGSESHILTLNQLPSHGHTMQASSDDGEDTSPVGNFMAVSDDRNYIGTSGSSMGSTNDTGGSQAVDHMSPFQAVNFIIALVGTFPSRN